MDRGGSEGNSGNDTRCKPIQLLSANPLALSYEKLVRIFDLIHQYLPEMEHIYAGTRIDDMKNKTVEELKDLKARGLTEIAFGTESGDDWTLRRINKGYTSADILEQCRKVEEAGIPYWVSFLNGVAGKEHSSDHAIHSAEIFNQLHPLDVGSAGLTLFPGTPLLEDAEAGKFSPLSEREMLEEERLFAETLNVDCRFSAHHTVSINLNTPDFLRDKEKILARIDYALEHGDLERYAEIRRQKRNL